MRRAMRWVGWVFAVLACLPLLVAMLVLVAANTQAGREWVERTVPMLTAGETSLVGFSGRFPDQLRLARLELRDAGGLWLAADDLVVDRFFLREGL